MGVVFKTNAVVEGPVIAAATSGMEQTALNRSATTMTMRAIEDVRIWGVALAERNMAFYAGWITRRMGGMTRCRDQKFSRET